MIWIYNILLTLLSPIWVPWMLLRANKRAEKVNWKQRSGEYHLPLRKGADRLWFHAVSVGEVVACLPILREIREMNPNVEIILSVTTSSGHQTAREKAEGLFDHLVYFPIDVPRFTLNALVTTKPRVVAIMETELWLNFLWAAETVGAKSVVVNGRISDRSFPRSQKFGFFYRALFRMVHKVFAQTATDAERFRALGVKETEVLGNCKFDQAVDGLEANPAQWRSNLGLNSEDFVVVIGSTRGKEEEDLVLEALADPRLSEIKVIHAPRHMETVEALAGRAQSKLGTVARRSKGEMGRYLILDTYGELSQVYSACDVAVIGGGFEKLGGQNLIQPLAHGKPVIHGPHMMNFRDAADMASRAGASIVASTASELAEALVTLRDDEAKRRTMGANAAAMIQSNLGASKRYAAEIVALLRAQS